MDYVSRMEDIEKRYEEEGGGFWKENEEGEMEEVEGESFWMSLMKEGNRYLDDVKEEE